METFPTEVTTRKESDFDDQADTRFFRGLLIALGLGAAMWAIVLVVLAMHW